MSLLSVVVEYVLPVVVLVLTPVLVLAGRSLYTKLINKLGLEGLAVYDEKIEQLVLRGIQYAEQKANAAAKVGGPKTSGEAKLAMALEFVTSELKRLGLPAKATEFLVGLIEAKLFVMKRAA